MEPRGWPWPAWQSVGRRRLLTLSLVPLWSSETPSPPNLYPLITCESPLSDESLVAMGCLAQDFLPSSITFSWNYKNNSVVNSQDITTFPPVLKEGKYVATSQVLLPSVAVLQASEDFLTCNVKHPEGNIKVPVPISGESGPSSLWPVGWEGEGMSDGLTSCPPHARASRAAPQRDCLHPTP